MKLAIFCGAMSLALAAVATAEAGGPGQKYVGGYYGGNYYGHCQENGWANGLFGGKFGHGQGCGCSACGHGGYGYGSPGYDISPNAKLLRPMVRSRPRRCLRRSRFGSAGLHAGARRPLR